MKKYLFEIIMSSILLFMCVGSAYIIFFPLQRKDLITLDMKLTGKPQMSTGKRINFCFNSMKQFEFYLDQDQYEYLKNKPILNRLKKGSMVTISIDRQAYFEKNTRTKRPFAIQSLLNWKSIQFIELKVENQPLLTLDQLVDLYEKKAYFYLIFGVCGITFIFSLLYINSRKLKNNNNFPNT